MNPSLAVIPTTDLCPGCPACNATYCEPEPGLPLWDSRHLYVGHPSIILLMGDSTDIMELHILVQSELFSSMKLAPTSHEFRGVFRGLDWTNAAAW